SVYTEEFFLKLYWYRTHKWPSCRLCHRVIQAILEHAEIDFETETETETETEIVHWRRTI
ncbi:MAG: hypothetical protein ACI945_002289, partial [Pseudohongiellaceae bacterium]